MRGPPYSGPRFFNPNTVHSVVIICVNRVHTEPAILSPIRPTQIDITDSVARSNGRAEPKEWELSYS